MKNRNASLAVLSLAVLWFGLGPARSQVYSSSAFNFQGRLYEQGLPANNLYDLQFGLYHMPMDSNVIGSLITLPGTPVSNGYFNVVLNFGSNAFNGEARYLEIQQRVSGVGAFQQRVSGVGAFLPLGDRVPIQSTPYAIYSYSAGIAALASNVSPGAITALDLAPGSVTSAAIADGSICLSNLCPDLRDGTFWKLHGNAGTIPGADFLGTTDDKALTLRVKNTPALRMFPDPTAPGATAHNLVGGFGGNVVAADIHAAVIAGGGVQTDPILGGPGLNEIGSLGDFSFLGGGMANTISGSRNAIVGGHRNQIVNGNSSVIAGGEGNLITAPVDSGAIGGGAGNVLTTLADLAVIAGGYTNRATSFAAFVGGGGYNLAGGSYSVVTGGTNNRALGESSSVAGGADNSATARQSAIGGGSLNAATAPNSTVAGGMANLAGTPGSVIAGGQYNFIGVTNYLASILGGSANTNVAPYATIVNGNGVLVDKYGQVAFGTRFAVNGDAQASFYHLRGVTLAASGTNAQQSELFLDGSGARLRLSQNSAWAFRALVVGKGTGATAAAWEVKGLVLNNGGTTTVSSTPALIGGGGGLSVSALPDDANDALVIRVTSGALSVVRWSAQLETAEVNAP